MIALLIVNLCLVLWFLARIGSERRHRIALEQALIGSFADARKREGHMSDRLTQVEFLASEAFNKGNPAQAGVRHFVTGASAH